MPEKQLSVVRIEFEGQTQIYIRALMKRDLKLQSFSSKNSCFGAKTLLEFYSSSLGVGWRCWTPQLVSPHPVPLGWGPAGRRNHGGGDWGVVLVFKKIIILLDLLFLEIIAL